MCHRPSAPGSARAALAALVALVALALLPACDALRPPGGPPGAEAKAAPAGLQLDFAARQVRREDRRRFRAAGEAYDLVRIEYGAAPTCDGAGDCSYSVYCGFVVGGRHYPLEVDWASEADALFDLATVCADGDVSDCELPGERLAIVDDEAFEAWAWEVDPDAEVIGECVDELY
jgi:hypothetical protein